jgi:hypothetical protein
MTPPTPPNNAFIQAAPTENDFEIRVTWADFLDEESYQLIANNDSTPGASLTSGEQPQLTNGWELIANIARNATEFRHNTAYPWTYMICGLGGFHGQELTCLGPSNYAHPNYPPVPAEIESLQISTIGIDKLGVQWIQSSDTVYSRAEISPRNGLPPVENDSNQSVLFTGLQPNVSHVIRVCVRNQGQTSQDETCQSVSARTWPLKPLALSSVSVNQSDPNPHERTIAFSYDNQRAHQIIGFAVRLLRDNRLIKDDYVFEDRLGLHEYRYKFTDLRDFTSYETWVIPYNRSGVGESAGIGFTTPKEINLYAQPLSGDSVMLHWNASIAGRYSIEYKSSTAWTQIYTVQLLQPAWHKFVLEGMEGPVELRLKWKFAFLNSVSTPVVAAPLAVGTPELISLRSTSVSMGELQRPGTGLVVNFRTTVEGRAEYLLQHQNISRLISRWITVDSTGLPTTAFADNATLTLAHAFAGLPRIYRVCKRQPSINPFGWTLLCSPSDQFASEGLIRLRLPSP